LKWIQRVSVLHASEVDEEDVLRGTTLKVYRFMLKQKNPVGIREIQRGLRLSSPSLATYHLSKLEKAGLVKQELEGYVVDKVVLRHMIRFRRMLIPKYFFYFILFTGSLILQLTIFRTEIMTSFYVFAFGVNVIAAALFLYETVAAPLDS